MLFLVYLYGEAAEDEKRKAVPQIRAGEYESLPEKVCVNPAQSPYYASHEPCKEKFGTTVQNCLYRITTENNEIKKNREGMFQQPNRKPIFNWVVSRTTLCEGGYL